MKKYFFLAAAAAMMLSACSFDRDLDYGGPSENPNGRISLRIGADNVTSNYAFATRSTNQLVQGDTISSYVNMGLFVLDDGNTTKSTSPALEYEFFNIEAKTGNIDATNKRTEVSAVNAADALVFPSDKAQGINLYAYAPYNSSPGITDIDASTINANVIAVSVQADQSTNLNYIKSDVLWGCVGENAKGNSIETTAGDGSSYPVGFTGKPGAIINGTNYLAAKTTATDGFVSGTSGSPISTPKVIIPMLHRASKVVVKLIVDGMPVSKLVGAQVKISAKASGELRIDNGTLTATGTASDIIMTDKLGYKKDETKPTSDAGYLTALTVSDSENDGIIHHDDDSNPSTPDIIDGYVCSAIVMPQALTASAKLFEIQLADGASGTLNTKYTYKLPASPSPATYDSGKVYTYTITVKASGLSVVATVGDWATGSTGTGNAELE